MQEMDNNDRLINHLVGICEYYAAKRDDITKKEFMAVDEEHKRCLKCKRKLVNEFEKELKKILNLAGDDELFVVVKKLCDSYAAQRKQLAGSDVLHADDADHVRCSTCKQVIYDDFERKLLCDLLLAKLNM